MRYKAILFDLDGTLVPMDMNRFLGGYFKGLAKKLERYDIAYDALVKSIWEGTKAMVNNDGNDSNRNVFWEVFEKGIGYSDKDIEKECLDFYANEFNEVKSETSPNPLAKSAVEIARDKADIVVLATNPVFPIVGQRTRMGWVGLSEKDFDLITSYESDSYCKPNPKYYESICERLNIAPYECLMIGNDTTEDMYAARSAGMDGYLVTDWLIEDKDNKWEGMRGTFAQMVDMLRSLEA